MGKNKGTVTKPKVDLRKAVLWVIGAIIVLASAIYFFGYPKLYSGEEYSFRYPSYMYYIESDGWVNLYPSKKAALASQECYIKYEYPQDVDCASTNLQSFVFVKKDKSLPPNPGGTYVDLNGRSWFTYTLPPLTGGPASHGFEAATALDGGVVVVTIAFPDHITTAKQQHIKQMILSTIKLY